MFVYVCCGSILNSVSCLLVASRVLLDSVVTSYAKLVLRISGVSTDSVPFKLNVCSNEKSTNCT